MQGWVSCAQRGVGPVPCVGRAGQGEQQPAEALGMLQGWVLELLGSCWGSRIRACGGTWQSWLGMCCLPSVSWGCSWWGTTCHVPPLGTGLLARARGLPVDAEGSVAVGSWLSLPAGLGHAV